MTCLFAITAASVAAAPSAETAPDPVRAAEQQRIDTMARAAKSVVCIFEKHMAGGGSGVIISPDGYGLTNFHVVAGMLETRQGLAGLADGKRYRLEVLGLDPTGDLAMFRLSLPEPPKAGNSGGKPAPPYQGGDRRGQAPPPFTGGGREGPFTHAPLGDSDTVQLGDWVFAMGNPFLLAEDYTPTVTHGIVSGTHRYQFGAGGRKLVYTDCIQVDASINPGNSGGPLFDLHGRLIGINGRASFEQRGRVNVGLGYAVSINQIKRFIPALRAGRLVEHATLGATTIDLGYRRVVFDKLLDDSAAAKAGIQVGDRLVHFAGRDIHSANDFLNLLGTFPAGWPVEITYEHENQLTSRTVPLDALSVKLEKPIPGLTASAPATATQSTLESPVASSDAAALTPPSPNPATNAIQQALRCTVKLYGAAIATEHGYGTGIMVSPDGHVLTVLSLLLEAADLRAVTHDGHVYQADVLSRDEYRQLALLKLHRRPENVDTHAPLDDQMAPPNFEAYALGEPNPVHPGDWILALGNPFKVAEGEEPLSVMKGIVSGRTRLNAARGAQPFPYVGDILLLDAITSGPGSPGSAVIDLDGHLIGMVGKAVTARQTNTLLNYALPVEELNAFVQDALAGANRTTQPAATAAGPGYHGIVLSRIAYHRQLPFVQRVAKGSPAEAAGLKPDDLIVSANGTAIPRARDFDELCERLHPGEELSLIVKRGEQLVPIRITLTEPPK